ncbi:DNA pilot protein [Tortoise microvirus 18]|nr:DNA pilot protein [Tortoise microvirus 18]
MGIITSRKAQKRAHNQAKELLELQEEAQKRLNEHLGAQNYSYEEKSAAMNYEYGEMAAENAYNRQREFYDYQQEQESLTNQFNEAQALGLNPLTFTGGATGGSGGGGGGIGSTGGTPGKQSGEVADYLALQGAEQNAKLLDIEEKKATAEIAAIGAEAANKWADTKLKNEERKSNIERSPIENELLKQEGIEKWIENTRKQYENRQAGDVDTWGAWSDQFGMIQIDKGSPFDQKTSLEIAEASSRINNNNASAELNTEKKKHYWQEIVNATKSADAQEAQAAAIKLAAEFNYGEYTNWKFWTKLAGDGINGIANLVK